VNGLPSTTAQRGIGRFIAALLTLFFILPSGLLRAEKLELELEKKLSQLESLNTRLQEASDKGDNAAYESLRKEWEKVAGEVSQLKTELQGDKETRAKAIAYFNEGNGHLQAGRFPDAVASYQKSLELDRTNAQVYYNLGYGYLKLKKDSEARAAFQNAVKFNGNYTAAYIALGNIAERLREDTDALANYKKALETDDKEVKAYFGIGNVHLRAARYKEAETFYRQAVEVDSKHDDSWTGLGRALKELGRNDEALEAFQTAAGIKPRDARTHHFIAELRNKKGNHAGALEAAEKALSLDRTLAAAWYEKGFALMSLGRKSDAIIAFEQAKNDRNWRDIAEHQIKVCKGLIPK